MALDDQHPIPTISKSGDELIIKAPGPTFSAQLELIIPEFSSIDLVGGNQLGSTDSPLLFSNDEYIHLVSVGGGSWYAVKPFIGT